MTALLSVAIPKTTPKPNNPHITVAVAALVGNGSFAMLVMVIFAGARGSADN